MKNQSQYQKSTWKQYLFNGPAVLVVAAGIAVGVGFAPQFVRAQDAENLTFTSPLDGGQQHDNRGRGSHTVRTFLANALGITVEELAAAREAAHEAANTGAEGSGDFQAQLAAELGITPEALVGAQEAARDAALAQAIENGRITEEEAALREAQSDLREAIDRTELVADILDISTEELEAAREAGSSIREIANELGVDGQALRAQLEAAYAEEVQQAVVDGIVTQEQADAFLADDDNGNAGRGNRGNREQGSDNNRGNRPERASTPDDRVGEHNGDDDHGDDANDSGGGTVVVPVEQASNVSTASTSAEASPANVDAPAEAPQPNGNRGERRRDNNNSSANESTPAAVDSATDDAPNNAPDDAPRQRENRAGGRRNRGG